MTSSLLRRGRVALISGLGVRFAANRECAADCSENQGSRSGRDGSIFSIRFVGVIEAFVDFLLQSFRNRIDQSGDLHFQL